MISGRALCIPCETNLAGLKERFSQFEDIPILEPAALASRPLAHVYFDLTLDVFRQEMTAGHLYHLFCSWESALGHCRKAGISIVILRHYPGATNDPRLEDRLQVLESYIARLEKYYHARTVYLPVVLCRRCRAHHEFPPLKVMHALKTEDGSGMRYSGKSTFHLLYERDFLEFFHLKPESITHPMLLTGEEISLADLYERSQDITGHYPLHFPESCQYRQVIPTGCQKTENFARYDLEAMVLDLTTFSCPGDNP